MDGLQRPPLPANEPVRDYAPGSPERATLVRRLEELSKEPVEAASVVGGEERGSDQRFEVRAPHDHGLHLATVSAASREDVTAAIDAAQEARRAWGEMDWRDRAAVFLKAADLLAGPWRDTLNAATMLGQSKTVHQAEIDAACELIDFWRFNVRFYAELLEEQPASGLGMWNRMDLRPLDGFVLAVSPFNFTAIAGNLPTAPALCGNTVVWKPSEKQALAAHFTMALLREAGLPDGVINLVHGDGAMVADVCTEHPDFGGLHFTGSAEVFRSLWERIGERVRGYRSFPRIVGETGGKDFVLAHASADVAALVTGLVRGAFEYQGQKCSAASRAYVPRSRWPQVRDLLGDTTRELAIGDVADFRTFVGAVIDEEAFERLSGAQRQAAADPSLEVLVGGSADRSQGWFVEPTVVVTEDPRHEFMRRELFGPLLTVFVYDDGDWPGVLDLVDTTSEYALTGAVFANDRDAVAEATRELRHAAGNFYVNDKPTGAVVGQQPFGGARGSGTNDKAGSKLNLVRWVSARTIKETFAPPHDWRYPYLDPS